MLGLLQCANLKMQARIQAKKLTPRIEISRVFQNAICRNVI